FILDLDSRGIPTRLRSVEEMADQLLADRNASLYYVFQSGTRPTLTCALITLL
ncbi:hypothetical protein FOC1_h10017672, partial [Fusarium oxysporum f. sp. cubense race 1]